VAKLPHAPNAPDATDQPIGFIMRDLNRDSKRDIAFAGYDALGDDMAGSFWLTNDNSATNCAPPSPAQLAIHVCLPTITKIKVNQAFLVTAGGDSPAGVKRIELWVDGKKAFETWNDQMRHWIALPAGRHRIVVVAVDMDDTHVVSPARYVTAS
jgi:hypothetical protein